MSKPWRTPRSASPPRTASGTTRDCWFPIERAPQRAALGLAARCPSPAPTCGRVRALLARSARQAGVAIALVRVPAGSPRIVESKSLKLYLNSFSQTPFDSAAVVERTIATDLGRALGAAVGVELVGARHVRRAADRRARGRVDRRRGDRDVQDYAPRPEFLADGRRRVEEALVSQLFKSNCPVTGQPDWGSVQVRYRGPRIDRAGLLRYLVSFRQHGGFHEHCVERMFVDVRARCRPES